MDDSEADLPARGSLSVLHVAQPTTEGVAVVVADLSAELEERGWRVTVAAPRGGYLQPKVEAAGATHVPWAATRSPGPRAALEAMSLGRIIRQVAPDVVHLHSSKAGLAGRLSMRGRLPTVFSPHAWSFFHAHGVQGTAALHWERFATRWTDVILCGSAEEVTAGEAAGVHGSYEMVTNSIGLAVAVPSRAEARAHLGLDATAPLCVCVGRLARQKGQDVLLQAWPAVRQRVPEARLLLVGDGPDRGQLEQLRGPGVTFAGAAGRDDVPEWIAAADLLAFPSRWETLSLAVLESLRQGRAVVVSDCSGMAEAMQGGFGRMVAMDDVPGFAAAIADYLGDLARAHGDGAKAAAAFEAVHAARRRSNLQRYVDLLRRVAGRNQAS